MKFYRLLYYNLYYNLFKIWLKKKDEINIAHINSVISITFLICVNLLSIPLILMALFNLKLSFLPEADLSMMINLAVGMITLGIINYFILGRKKQHLKIVKEFSKEKYKKSKLYTIIYITITLLIPLYILLFTSPNK